MASEKPAPGRALPTTMAQLRRNLWQTAIEDLSDDQLLALVLGHGGGGGRRGRDPLGLATNVLQNTGGLAGLARQPLAGLEALPGLGPARAGLLKAALELGRRSAAPAPPPGRPLHCPADVVEWYRCRLQDLEAETIHALLLDNKNRPLRSVRLASGSWSHCPLDPKLVYATCLREGASALILVHNHPSGDPQPSREDLELTERLSRAGRLMGIKLLDHLIVARAGHVSLADRGLL